MEGRAVSTGEVFDKISARLVPFEMVAKVFKDMTSEGGKFYNMQEVQAETLRGKISNLKDAYEMMLNEIGSAHSDKLKGAVDGLRSLMRNWEAIGSQIVYLIKLFGAYKAAVGLLTISDTIAQFGGLTKALKQTAIAQKLLNSALLTNPYIAVGTAILGIVMALRNATKASREFKAEIDKIANTQYGEADKAVDRYNKLTNELKSATKGSHDYREAISKLNNEYGEYLPQLLDEKNALDLIKTSSDAVTASIYNRARARAYERSQQKTEDMYGESRDYYTSVFLQKLRDNGISEKAARDLFLNFNEAIKDQADGWNPAEVFNQVYKAYFSTTEDYFTEVGNALNDIKQNTPFIRNIYGENTTGWMTARDALWNYALVQNKVLEAEKEYNDILETRWGNGAKSDTESQKLSQIAVWYDKQTAAINAAGMSEQERIERLKNLDISKLQLLVQLYEELDKNPNTARTDLLNKYRDELSALTKQLDGWQKKVADALNPFGIKGKGAGDYGLFADESTSYLEYVNNLRNSYKGLAQQIADTAKANPKLNAELKKQKEVIEAVAKALNIDLMLSSNTTESNEEKRIKRLITSLRKLQTQYEKLKTLGVSDESIKTLFEGLYPELIAENGKDFVTDLKYIERAVELVADLEKIAPEDAKKILVDLGTDEFSALVKQLEKQNKAYKETAKAAEDYFNTLRKWASEDFNIGGEGITFDLSKIMSDLREKTNEIDLKAQKTREMLSQIDLDSEEEIANVKAVFEKEFGTGTWEEFWNDYYINGFDAIQALADKQKEYEKNLAQERMNDLAEKYVKESYFTQGIEISDLGDKTLLQVRRIKKQLQDLMSEEPLKIPVEVENLLRTQGVDISNLKGVYLDEIYETLAEMGQPIDEATQSILNLIQRIQEAGLSTEKFGEVIRKVFEGDLEDLTEEEGKLLSEMVEDYLGEMQSLFESIGSFAEKIGNDKLQGAMNGIAQSMQILGNVADKLAKGDWIGAIISGVTSLAKVILDAVSAQEELNRAIEETRNEMMLLASQKAINEGVESIFGTDDYKKFTNAYDEAVKAHKQALEDIEKQNQEFTGRSKDNWGWGGILGSVATGAATGAGIGALAGGWFGGITIAAGAIFGGIAGLIAGITGAAATAMNDYAVTLQQMADEIGGDLINEQTGGFNSETLKKIKDTYTDLDAESQEMLDKLIANAEVYENAITEVATYMTDIFGQCADEMADAFIDSFKKSGEAALDYGDIMDSVATSIAKSMIKSAIIQNVWDDEKSKQAAAMLASGDAGGAMQIVDEAMRAAQDLAPHIQELLKSLEPYLQMEEEKPENTLGSGIKGITEDTANLLASYLNAIRADVSYAKTLWERMDANTQSIAAALAGFSAPSLMEYQAQIAANTYNTSISTQNILIELRSVMGFGDEGRAIRILS